MRSEGVIVHIDAELLWLPTPFSSTTYHSVCAHISPRRLILSRFLSDDVIRPSIVEFCAISAKLFFLAGLASLMTVPFLVGVYYFLRGFGVNVLLTVPIVIVIFYLFMLALRRKGFLFS